MCPLCVCLSAAHQLFPQTSRELSVTQQRVPEGGTTQFEKLYVEDAEIYSEKKGWAADAEHDLL